MRNRLLNSTSAATLVVTAALSASPFATDVEAGGLTTTYKPATIAPHKRWHGFFIGAHVGGGDANWDGVFDNGALDSTVFADRLNTDGVLGGVHAGFNWQHGLTVFGIEADVSFMEWDDVAKAISSSEEIKGEVDSLASVRGRIGIVVGEAQQTLIFASLGAAWANATGTVFQDGQNAPAGGVAFDFDDVGGVVGAGFEHAMSDRFRLRVDGSYYWFDENVDLFAAFGAAGEASPGDNLEFEDVFTVRVGGSVYINPN